MKRLDLSVQPGEGPAAPARAGLSRREALGLASCAALVAGAAGAGLGRGTSPAGAAESPESPEPAESPAQASVLRVGLSGSSSDSLDPASSNALHLPYTVKFNTLDCLAYLADGKVEMGLATAFTPNDDATEWTVAVREGVTFHDGSPLTADDVLYSLRYIASSPVGYGNYANVDFDASTSDGARTVVLKLMQPQATFVETALAAFSFVFPEGTVSEDFSRDLGSGPYVLESFDPDSGAVLTAYEGYWDGAPQIARLELYPMADAATRTSALAGGQIDYADGVSATDAATVASDPDIALLSGGVTNSGAYEFILNCSIPPFDDVELRRAFKQAVDREALVGTVFRGEGEAGNDVVGKGLPGYNVGLQPHALDVEAAAKTFADKGVSSIAVLTSEVVAGINDSVTLLGQQLEPLGVSLDVTQIEPSTVYTTNAGMIAQTQVFASYYINRPFATHAPLYTSAASPYNFSAWKDEAYNELIEQAAVTVDDEARQSLFDQAQEKLWEEGGDVVWGFSYDLALHTARLKGVRMSQSIPLFSKASLS